MRHAGIVDQDVEPAKGAAYGLHRLVDLRAAGDIASQRDGAVADP
jgi:hypothetical protein